MIHSQLLIVDRNMINHLNTFGRKVIIFSDNVFQQKKVKSAGVCVNYHNNNGVFKMLIHCTVRWPFKTEHSVFKAVVTRVTLSYFRDSRYNVTLCFGVKRSVLLSYQVL